MSFDGTPDDQVRQALRSGDGAALQAALARLEDRSERARAMLALDEAAIRRLAALLGDDGLGDVLESLEADDAARLLTQLHPADAADVLEAMAPDDAADLVGELPEPEADRIIVAMEPGEAEELRELLAYPPDTAGGRMTPAFVSVAPGLRASEAIDGVRRVAREAETLNYVYVTDADDHLLGVLSFRNLVLSQPDTPVADLLVTDIVTVPALADQEEAAQLLVERGLLALPVVTEDGRLVGIVTADDVADILREEVTEDIERLGGSEPLDIPYLEAQPFFLWRKRVGWLLALFVAEAYTGTVLRHFEGELEAAVTLAFFIPLLIGTGGNVGSQVTTTIIRAMSIGRIHVGDIARIVRKELATGLLLGVVMALATFTRAMTLRVGISVGIVVATTVILIIIWASLIASVLPLVLRQLRVDPAVVSAPFITTLVDGTGLVIYFTVARYVLHL